MSGEYDIFISYRRDGGFETARIIYERLRGQGYSVFFDVETLRSGKFNNELYRKIEQCRDFIVVLAPGSLDRCENEGDWLRLEIAHAIKHDKNVVPVMTRGFEMPTPESLPPDIADLTVYNGPKASREYFDAFLELLLKFLKSAPHTPPSPAAAAPAKRRRRALPLILAGLLIVVAVAYLNRGALPPFHGSQPAPHVAAPPADAAPQGAVDAQAVNDARQKALDEKGKALSSDAKGYDAEGWEAAEKKLGQAGASSSAESYREAAQLFAQCTVRAEERRKAREEREAAQNEDAENASNDQDRLEVSTHAAPDSGPDKAPTDPEAQFALAKKYDTGDGVAKDEAKAVEWYKKAAEQGHAKAQFNLGVDYSNGIGVAKDEAEAVKWYQKAAEQEDAEAQYNLGVCYLNGAGVAKDDEEAVKWFRKATEQGNADGQNNLGS